MTTNKDVRELMEARKASGVPFPKPTRPKLSMDLNLSWLHPSRPRNY